MALFVCAVMTRTSADLARAAVGGFTDDVGEWTEPLGLASMVAEGLVICVRAGEARARG